MQVSVRFSSVLEAQNMMRFIQQYYGAFQEMEKYSIDNEKRVVFLSGEPSALLKDVRDKVITSRWEAGMPLQALYIYCWMAVKSSFRNQNDSPVVYVLDQEFELCFNYTSMNDTQKILVDPIGICVNDSDNSILSHFLGGTSGILSFFNKKLQKRHIEHVESIMRQLDGAYRQFN